MSRQSAVGIFFIGCGLLALLAVVAVAVHQRDQLSALREQNQSLQDGAREMVGLRAENQEAHRVRNQETEIQQLREHTKELLRLRNEVRQLREQQQELETLRAANAQLLQAFQGSASLPNNQMALVTSARRKGSLLGVSVVSANDPRSGAGAGGRAGVVVTGLADSTAPESGLKPGDLIIALDGRAMANAPQLQAEMLTRKPGETVVVDVLRGNEAVRLQVKTRAWPESP